MDSSEPCSVYQRKNIYSLEFEEEVPLALRLLVIADNVEIENQGYADIYLSELLVDTFTALGALFIQRNGNDMVNESEKENLSSYLDKMKEYIRKEMLRPRIQG